MPVAGFAPAARTAFRGRAAACPRDSLSCRTLLLLAALAPLFVQADAPLAAGTQLNFRGSVEPGSETSAARAQDVRPDAVDRRPKRRRRRSLLVGGGAGPRRVSLARAIRPHRASIARGAPPGPAPALLYDRGDGRSVVPIPLPFLAEEQPLAAGAKFQDGKFELTVEKPSKTADRASWKVGVRDPFGPRAHAAGRSGQSAGAGPDRKSDDGPRRRVSTQARMARRASDCPRGSSAPSARCSSN